MINVTQPFLPPLEEFIPYLEEIWKSKWLTNSGQFHQQLENDLACFLGVPYISLYNNGTNALITALQALDLQGKVITTPFTFVATANSLIWNNLTPVFVDIDPHSFNIDPKEIEKAITDNTSAILAVHVYGNPCDVDAINCIAKKYNLKVIYDAAHAFGVKYEGNSILNHGDFSILSLHATKVFNTFEGGVAISRSPEMKCKIDKLKNFGIDSELQLIAPGNNGKMNELQAAMGLLQLKYFLENQSKRKRIVSIYNQTVDKIDGIDNIKIAEKVEWNYAYYPLIIDKEVYGMSRDELYEKLNENGFNCRKYFFPLITDFKVFYKKNRLEMANARKISNNVLCLPIYPDLEEENYLKIAEIIEQNNKR